MRLSNSEVANALDMNHSSVSRMRSGHRVASVETLRRIIQHFGADATELMDAATKASQGDSTEWVAILNRLFDDGQPDPDPDPELESEPAPELIV